MRKHKAGSVKEGLHDAVKNIHMLRFFMVGTSKSLCMPPESI